MQLFPNCTLILHKLCIMIPPRHDICKNLLSCVKFLTILKILVLITCSMQLCQSVSKLSGHLIASSLDQIYINTNIYVNFQIIWQSSPCQPAIRPTRAISTDDSKFFTQGNKSIHKLVVYKYINIYAYNVCCSYVATCLNFFLVISLISSKFF